MVNIDSFRQVLIVQNLFMRANVDFKWHSVFKLGKFTSFISFCIVLPPVPYTPAPTLAARKSANSLQAVPPDASHPH